MICSTIQIECTLFLNYLIILIYAYSALKQHTRKRLVCKWWWKCQKHMIVWKYQRWWHTLLKISYKKETIETILKINFRLVTYTVMNFLFSLTPCILLMFSIHLPHCYYMPFLMPQLAQPVQLCNICSPCSYLMPSCLLPWWRLMPL